MGADLVQAFPAAARLFAEADDALDFPLSRLCFEGPETTLALTEHAQPAILTASLAAFRVLQETAGLVPSAMAGHSLGEWSALVAAGSLTFADAVRAVRARGRCMQAAVPVGQGAMAAVLGLDADAVAELCREAAGGDVLALANLNGGGQVVVAGHAAAVDRLVALVSGGRARAQRLAVSAPFHCALMAPAAAGLARHLEAVEFQAPRIPVVTSVAARSIANAAEIRTLLVEQVTAPVRWEETARVLGAGGATLALEVGPGRVLAGLLRRILPEMTTIPAGDTAAIAKAREALA